MKTNITLMAVAAVMINTAWITPATSPTITKEKKITVAADPGFSFFRVHRQGKNGATATWGLTANSNVSGFLLEKTYEDATDPYAYWETVSSVPATGERSYKVTDNVFPGFITYRVTAYLNDGRTIYSELTTLHINSH